LISFRDIRRKIYSISVVEVQNKVNINSYSKASFSNFIELARVHIKSSGVSHIPPEKKVNETHQLLSIIEINYWNFWQKISHPEINLFE
jgi:hypothetical protein